jgi:hypothetical protein
LKILYSLGKHKDVISLTKGLIDPIHLQEFPLMSVISSIEIVVGVIHLLLGGLWIPWNLGSAKYIHLPNNGFLHHERRA